MAGTGLAVVQALALRVKAVFIALAWRKAVMDSRRNRHLRQSDAVPALIVQSADV
jgi:hypothetical protein